MSRQIKFRAWDKKEKIMRKRWDELYPECTKGLELMQFTGLLDKNGKEIYEGDIITDGKKAYEIKWWSGIETDEYAYNYTGWRAMEKEERYQGKGVASNSQNIKCYGHYGLDTDKCEVIGNIYENPELLTN